MDSSQKKSYGPSKLHRTFGKISDEVAEKQKLQNLKFENCVSFRRAV